MKFPVCYECVKNNSLCKNCKQKLDSRELTQLDLSVARALLTINKKRNISSASFERAINVGKYIIIFTKGDVGILVGKKGRTVSEISRFLGKRVRIVRLYMDMHKTVEDIVFPAELKGINIVYSEGGEYYKIRIGKNENVSIPFDIDVLNRILVILLGTENIEICFE